MKIPRVLWILMAWSAAAGGVQARGGGKAEPFPIEFAAGHNTATIREHVRGDEQFESSVAVKAGQWLGVEITGTPRDAATFYVSTPDGVNTTPQYRWSDTAKQAGDYLITVIKSGRARTARFALTVTVGARPKPLPFVATDRDSVALSTAMRHFIDAVRRQDRAAFLPLFSRTRPFSQLNPMNIGNGRRYRTTIRYSTIVSDLHHKTGLYNTYFERLSDANTFADNTADGKPWQRFDDYVFVPPGQNSESLTYVKWRREGRRWVVDEISYPQL